MNVPTYIHTYIHTHIHIHTYKHKHCTNGFAFRNYPTSLFQRKFSFQIFSFRRKRSASQNVKPTTHLSNTLLAFQTEFQAEYEMLKPNKNNSIKHTKQK